MGIRFDLEIYGDKLVSRDLTRFSDRAVDARPAFHQIADGLRRQEASRFDRKGFGTWAPLAASTIAEKARKGLDPRILHATRRLRTSLTVKGAEDSVEIIQPQFMVFGTSVPYARFHQKGEGVPTRKPVGFTEAGKRSTIRILQRYLVTGEA